MHYVYIAKGQSQYYVGSTADMAKRVREHKSGKTKSLKSKGPFEVVYTKQFTSKTEAIKEEHRIKSFKGGNAFKKLIQNSVPIV